MYFQKIRDLNHTHWLVNSEHCKTTWITLTTFLGYLSCISVTKNRYQIGILDSSLRSFFFSYTLFSEDLFGYIPSISSHNHATKELSRSKKGTTKLTRNAAL